MTRRRGASMLVVGIVALCIVLTLCVGLRGFGDEIGELSPFVLILVVLGYAFYRRIFRLQGRVEFYFAT